MNNLKNIINNFEQSYNNLLKNQNSKKLKQGCYVYELEADTTIPSEYILLMHFLGKIEIRLQEKIVKYILSKQNQEGGWPLFYDGETDISASVKAYYALKLAGLNESSDEMVKAKECILRKGGVERVNVFTRITLALYGQITWSSIPYMPIEIMLFPKWFPFNIYKISYWSRTVLVPLLIIMRRKPIAQNPNRVFIKELFKNPNNFARKIKLISNKNSLSQIFVNLDKTARLVFPFFSKGFKEKCENFAVKWILKRLNGLDGLGGIFPAMVNALIALIIVDERKYSQKIKIAKKAIDKLIVEKKDYAYCQPCFSPVWDSGWMGLINIENGIIDDELASWFLKKEIKIKGDWSHKNNNIDAGGWAFQFNNDYYPDVDDTALVGMFLDRYNRIKKKKSIQLAIERTRNWIVGMQSKNGGWGAFDIDNVHYALNSIPFADHGALLDPPTADVSARCLSFLKQLDNPRDKKCIERATSYLLSEQEEDGSWYGRWGTNYIYGTWSVLSALNLVEFRNKKAVFDKAIDYLKSNQRNDGGWGEDGKSYYKSFKNLSKQSTPSQTSWAIMALLAAGQINSSEVEKGLKYLTNKKTKFQEDHFTAVGFPKVFYLKYHGYAEYFPLLAIAKIKNQLKKNSIYPNYGT